METHTERMSGTQQLAHIRKATQSLQAETKKIEMKLQLYYTNINAYNLRKPA